MPERPQIERPNGANCPLWILSQVRLSRQRGNCTKRLLIGPTLSGSDKVMKDKVMKKVEIQWPGR